VLYERLTCDEHFELFGRAYGMTEVDMERSRDDIYTTLGFAEWRGARVEELSGGTRAKLNLGLALLPDPDLSAARRALRRVRLGHLPAVLAAHPRPP
jgi:ABC-2 type transport system ATP-binding protein